MTGVVYRFEVCAQIDPQIIPRLVNFFAQRGLTPTRFRSEVAGDQILATIDQDGINDREAQLIAEKMRASVLVDTVLTPVPMEGESIAHDLVV